MNINPQQCVPYIRINGEMYTESASILRMSANLMPSLKRYYPANPFLRHRVDAAMDFCGTVLRPAFQNALILRYDNYSHDGPNSKEQTNDKIHQAMLTLE